MELPGYVCPWDGVTAEPASLQWRCPRCGSPWDLEFVPGPVEMTNLAASRSPTGATGRPASMWRYAEALPLPAPQVSLGEGGTPLVGLAGGVRAKLDFLMPTLSFKDRGSAVLLELARRLGPDRVVADSSGNAGASVAAYAARAGLPCTVHVPGGTASAKVARIAATGAEVVAEGDREHAAALARAAADEPSVFYASHVYNPYFLHGTKTYAYEIWDELGGLLPEVLVLPVGNGTLLLGVAIAVEELRRRGLIARAPTLVAVQSAAVAPLAAAWSAGADDLGRPATDAGGQFSGEPDAGGLFSHEADAARQFSGQDGPPSPGSARSTVAEGIAIARPPRARQVLAAVRASGGEFRTVDDEQITAARAHLARHGLLVEPTAAACWAAVRSDRDLLAADLVLPLCGAGR